MTDTVEDLLFFKLKDLITEQSEGEWTDTQIFADAIRFANALRPMLAASPQGEGSSGDTTNMIAPVEAVAWWEKVRAILDDTVDAETYGPFDDWARAVPESLDAAADAILDLIQSERAG